MTVKDQIKHTGATFTPTMLANYLASKLLRLVKKRGTIKVLDPACGTGELLQAMGYALKQRNREFHLTGYDSNSEYLNKARERSLVFGRSGFNYELGDFLEAVELKKDQLNLDFIKKSSSNLINEYADLIIANPPYVRNQILGSERSQHLARKFNLKGRLDLYYPFLIAMTESLKIDGILGVITSNRYLSTKGGGSIRQYLVNNYDVIEVIDLGDTKIFDTAVLPAIFIGKRRSNPNFTKSKFLKIYEELSGYPENPDKANSIYQILETTGSGYFCVGKRRYKKTEGVLKYNIETGGSWEMLSAEETEWVSTIVKNSKHIVGELFKVRVGIKTTADKVFISDRWAALGEDRPEDELLKGLISQENIKAWRISEKVDLKVLYPHFSENGKKKTIDIDLFPKAKSYFEIYREKLKSRKYVIEAGRNWFEIWVPQNPAFWSKPKLVFPDISPMPRFYFDEGGKIVNGNCYWIVAEKPEDKDKLLLIQGIANTNLMTRYHDLVFNNKLYSGRRRYLTQYVERYPLPDLESDMTKEIVSIVRKLNDTKNEKSIDKFKNDLEVTVGWAFGVPPIFRLD